MKYCVPALLLFEQSAIGQASSPLSLKSHIALPNISGRIDLRAGRRVPFRIGTSLKASSTTFPPISCSLQQGTALPGFTTAPRFSF